MNVINRVAETQWANPNTDEGKYRELHRSVFQPGEFQPSLLFT